MNSYVHELFARERAADFKREVDQMALAQLAKRTRPQAPSAVEPGLPRIFAAVWAAIGRIGRRREPADPASHVSGAGEA